MQPAYLKSGDSGAIKHQVKHCMDAKAGYTPLATRLRDLSVKMDTHDVTAMLSLWAIFSTLKNHIKTDFLRIKSFKLAR